MAIDIVIPRFIVSVATGALLCAGLAEHAFAHAVLIGAEPSERAIVSAPPDRVRLFFSEPVDPDFFGVEVYDASRQRVDRHDAHISASNASTLEVGLNALSAGTYVVVWRVVSLDTHVVRDSFAFTVGVGVAPRAIALELPSVGSPAEVEAVVRWLTYLAALLLLGGLAFRPLIVAPANAHQLDGAIQHRWIPLAFATVGALVCLSFATLFIQSAAAAGVPLLEVLNGHAVSRTLQTRLGMLLVARGVLLLALLGVLATLSVFHTRRSRYAWWAGAGVSVLVLLTITVAGHATTQTVPAIGVVVDWLHLIAAGVWLGGLVQLVLVVKDSLIASSVVRRFSMIAAVCVALLLLTGAYSALAFVPNWQAMIDSAYGAALSGKLLVLIPLLGLALVNLLLRGRSWFRTVVIGEVCCVAGVIAVTAVLVGQPPASSLPLQGVPFSQTVRADDFDVTLGVTPNQAGDNRVTVQVDEAGRPLTDPRSRVHLSLTMLEMEMGTREVDAPGDGRGTFAVSGGYLSMPGRWRADVQVSRDTAVPTVSASFPVLVGQAPGVSRPAFSPAYIVYLAVTDPDRQQNAPIVNPLFVATLVSLAAAVAVVIGWRSIRASGRSRRLAPLAAAVLVASSLSFGSVSIGQAYRKSLPNPVPADPSSIDRGKVVYQSCVACHGAAGRGDGPAGRTLNPRPADFRIHMAAGHTDRQLFDWISRGIDGTAMPAFSEQLSDQQRWDVINYIRTFAAQ